MQIHFTHGRVQNMCGNLFTLFSCFSSVARIQSNLSQFYCIDKTKKNIFLFFRSTKRFYRSKILRFQFFSFCFHGKIQSANYVMSENLLLFGCTKGGTEVVHTKQCTLRGHFPRQCILAWSLVITRERKKSKPNKRFLIGIAETNETATSFVRSFKRIQS